MKKTLTTLALTGLTAAAFGQGYVDWAAPGADIVVQTNAVTYSSYSTLGNGQAVTPAVGAVGNATSTSGTYYYELLYAASGTTLSTTAFSTFNNWTATGLTLQEGGANGRTALSSISPANNAVDIDAAWVSGPLQMILVGWSSNLGTTWAGVGGVQSELASDSGFTGTAYFGTSYVGTVTPNTSTTLGGILWASSQSAGGLISNPTASPMVLNEVSAVPEPTTLALTAMGAASLLAFRRRK
jgi:hypothetical protein